jgi:hypothetical protein
VAVVHEWLTTFAGSETVLREILALFPQADLFTLVDFLSEKDRASEQLGTETDREGATERIRTHQRASGNSSEVLIHRCIG